MNIKYVIVPAVAALALAGCQSLKKSLGWVDAPCVDCSARKTVSNPADPVMGNWSGKLSGDDMIATSLIFTRDAKGVAQAVVLWRWGSPLPCSDVVVKGNTFSFRHPYGVLYRGKVVGDTMTGETASCDKDGKPSGKYEPFTGWRNTPTCPRATSKGVKLGEGIDLLKDGLDGWKSMNPKAKFGWEFKDGVLSNKLGLNKDGGWAGGGANLMSKRADFKDFNLEYDVRVPKNSNSGVYLRGRFECQVIDSYGKPVDCHNMAAYYGRVTPKVAAEKPAGEWQHVNVTLANRHITIVLNGQTIIDDAEIVGVTGGAIDADMDAAGPIYLQGDHSDADFKNMILRPVVK